MKKTDYKEQKLSKGVMNVYDFGAVKLHAYKTNDFIDDEVFLLEKGGELAVIESPAFFDNVRELESYVKDLGVTVRGVLISYHAAGGTFLPDAPKYATHRADAYGHSGGGKALIDNFTGLFGAAFDNSLHTTTNFIEGDSITVAGIRFNVVETSDGYDLEIPEINAVYTHMLGHDCHSIVAGQAHADALIETLENFLARNYDLILTSHYTPEDVKDVQTKIDYLKRLCAIASQCGDGAQMKERVTKEYPQYAGGNYLDMSVAFFFPKKA